MLFWRILYRNTLRHPLRSFLTALGIAVALFAFCMIRTIIDAWYAGVELSARNRLVVRNAVSLIFYLPLSYADAVARTPGVARMGYGNWFGGMNKRDENYRFAQFAVDDRYLDVYSEYKISTEAKAVWLAERKGMLIGQELAERFGWRVGETVQLEGTIFPGLWEFSVSGILERGQRQGDTRVAFFHWDYLNERNRVEMQRYPDHVGFFVVELAPGADAGTVSKAIDQQFANSYAETLTETESAFVQGFISMSSSIILMMNIVSIVIIMIMLLVVANTMFMSFRERMREYTIYKALGFDGATLAKLLLGEALLLSGIGFVFLLLLLLPIVILQPQSLLGGVAEFFPRFDVRVWTVVVSFLLAAGVAALACVLPMRRLSHFRVSEGLREIG